MMGRTMLAFAVMLALSASAAAQMTKTITGEKRSVSATVEAVERSTRQLTVKTTEGKYEVLYAPEELKRFAAVNVGDQIKVTYYENLILRLKQPGEKDVDTRSRGVTPGEKPGGTVSHQRTITATITAIDPKVPSITFSGPHDWTYTSRVEDKAALAKVKVGDKVDITWTEAMILSLDSGDAKKK